MPRACVGLTGQEDVVGGGVWSHDPDPSRDKENNGLQRCCMLDSLEPVEVSYQRDVPDVIKLQNLR